MKNKLLLIFFLFSTVVLKSQKTLPSDTFKVVKEYQPILVEAKKITSDPVIDDDLKIELDLNYSFVDKQVPVSYEVEPIKAAKIKGEPLVKLYNGYSRIGVGNSMVPFAEVYYNNLRSKKYSIGGHAKYLNMIEVNDIEDSEMSNMHFEVFGKRFWKTNTLDGKVSFNKHDFNYYGFNQINARAMISDQVKPDLAQSYNRLSGNFNLKSTKRDSFNLRHEANVRYNMLSNSSSDAEHNVKVDFNLNQFKNRELYNIDVLIDFNQYDFQSSNSNTIIGLKPQVSTIGDKFRINAGLGVYVNAGEETDFHFYPLAEVKYNVIEDVLVPYAGVKGEIKRVNYNSITLENPFVAENIGLANTNEKYNLYAGFRGSLSSKFTFNLSGANVMTDNAYLFIQLPRSLQEFVPSKEYYLTYDEINEIQIKGELVYRMDEKLQVYAQGEYFRFDTELEEEAWHRPELKITTSARYNLRDKILVRLDLIYWGEQFARDVETVVRLDSSQIFQFTSRKLDGIFDANLGVEYRYTKRLSAFVQFNNIGGINFEKYQDYPTQGFNVWGGFTYGF